jgi:hypothetical protein
MMRRSKRGQSLVETALILPMLVLLLFSIIDFSYVIYNWSEVQFAARRGAEEGSKQPYCNGDDEAIKAQAMQGGNWTGITKGEIGITYLQESGGSYSGSSLAGDVGDPEVTDLDKVVQVRVRHLVDPLTPVGETIFRKQWFVAYSRRTIIGLSSPLTGC